MVSTAAGQNSTQPRTPGAFPRHHWALRHLPAFPAAAARLLRLLNDPDAGFSEFAEVIESDPSFAWEVLKAANSPLIGLPFEVDDIRHAVAIVGVERVKGLVLVIALSREFRHAFREPRLVACWKHCLAVAQLSAELAPSFGVEPGLAYTAGLLHDLGRIALMTTFPQKYAGMIGESSTLQVEMRELEQKFFEIDHCVAGATMMQIWSLPESLQDICLRHHNPISLYERGLLANVVAANRIAHMSGFRPVYEPPGSYGLETVPGGVPDRILDSMDALHTTIDGYCSSL